MTMGNFGRPISWEPRALTKVDKHATHTHAHTNIDKHPHTHTHTHTHRKNTSIVVLGMMETDERESD